MNRTFLYESHLGLGSKFVNFSGWEMPIHYGSQINEHNSVRNSAGIFDVSHMNIFDFCGVEAKEFMRHVLTNDVNKIDDGYALYSVITNNEGGIIDDLIVYKFNNEKFRVVSNCSTFDDVNNFFESNIIKFDCEFHHKPSLGILAIQGPESEIALKISLNWSFQTMKVFHLLKGINFSFQGLVIQGKMVLRLLVSLKNYKTFGIYVFLGAFLQLVWVQEIL